MKIVKNSIIPFPGFVAINLFGVLFVREEYADEVDAVTLNHEAIHTAQMKELGYVPFYLIYFVEWLFRLLGTGNAYRNISFEQEAYAHQGDLTYLETREPYAQWL